MKILRSMEHLHLASTINKLLTLFYQINQWNRSCFHCLKNLLVNFLKSSSLCLIQIIIYWDLAKLQFTLITEARNKFNINWLYLSAQILRKIAGLIQEIVMKLHQGIKNIKVNIRLEQALKLVLIYFNFKYTL